MSKIKSGLSIYTSGEYFSTNMDKHRLDADYKTKAFLSLFVPTAKKFKWNVTSYADVGCGSGDVARGVSKGLSTAGFELLDAIGYEISPGIEDIPSDDLIRFICADFTQEEDGVDLVTLFDVFEHVLDPVCFLKNVSANCRYIGLHIPLDNNLNNSIRDLYKHKLHAPGHLIFLDTPQALTMLAMAGIRVTNYNYTFNFNWPTGQQSTLARLAVYPRRLLTAVSPWLASRFLGGCSLMVIGECESD